MTRLRSKIVGTGAFVPEARIDNSHFWNTEFYAGYDKKHEKDSKAIVTKFEEVAGISSRRYAEAEVRASDMAAIAARRALEAAGNLDPESLDYIILAHNWGDVSIGDPFYDLLPNIAARVKNLLGIQNPECVAYDILFGCPGWIQAMIQADYYLRTGDAKRILVIGADAVSRVVDPHDVDSMLFADGAGAVVVEAFEDDGHGILAHKTISDCNKELGFLKMGKSYNAEKSEDGLYLKMEGRSVFRYGMEKIPGLILDSLKRANLRLEQVDKIVMHQANAKMIRLIAERLYTMEGLGTVPEGALPMNVGFMGNNSVATIPVMLNMILNGKLEGQEIKEGDLLVMASVGAGMHANSMVYRV